MTLKLLHIYFIYCWKYLDSKNVCKILNAKTPWSVLKRRSIYVNHTETSLFFLFCFFICCCFSWYSYTCWANCVCGLTWDFELKNKIYIYIFFMDVNVNSDISEYILMLTVIYSLYYHNYITYQKNIKAVWHHQKHTPTVLEKEVTFMK